ncbi:MAG TPA: helix-turn-helix domain-containing protein, partial [Candidatus Paceibacterota bacterium]
MNQDFDKIPAGDLKWLSMSEAASLTPYSAEYLSLLARRKKLSAKKIGKTWYTTKAVLDEYMKRQMIRTQVLQGGNLSALQMAEAPRETIKEVAEPEIAAPRPAVVSAAPVANHPETKHIRTYQHDLKTYLENLHAHKEAPSVLVPTVEKKAVPAIELAVPVKALSSFVPNVPKPIVAPVVAVKPVAQAPVQNLDAIALTLAEISKKLESLQASRAAEPVQAVSRSGFVRNNPFVTASRIAFSKKPLAFVTIVTVLFFTIFPTPFVYGFVDKIYTAVKKSVFDASTVMGFRPGTHENEILLLDKEGNVSIMGHIETEGQFRSYAKDGIAPIVVDSKTEVKNLNAEFVGGVPASGFTLAYVTKNGAVTTDDVFFEGSVEVGKTLLVKGATKLLSSVQVDGDIAVFGDAHFNRSLHVNGPAYLDAIVNTGTASLGNVSVSRNISVRGSIDVGQAVVARSGSFRRLSTGDFEATGEIALGNPSDTITIDAKNLSITDDGGATFHAGVSVADDLSVGGTITASALSVGSLSVSSILANGVTLGDLIASSTIAEFSTTTNATTTNLFAQSLSSLFADIASLVADDISVGALTAERSTTTQSTSTSAFAENLSATNATTTNSYATRSYIESLIAESAIISSLVSSDATSTNATSTNLFAQSLRATGLSAGSASIDDATIASLQFTNATGTAATTTNLFSSFARITTGVIDSFSSTLSNISSLVADNIDVGALTVTNSTTTNATTTNLYSSVATIGGDTLVVDSSHNVGIGTSSPSQKLSIAGNAYIAGNTYTAGNGTTTGVIAVTGTGTSTFSGDVSVAGNLSFGSGTGNTIAINSAVASNLVPDTNIMRDIGSPSYYWRTGYFDTINVNSISAASTTIAGTASNDFTINSNNVSVDAEDSNLIFKRGAVTPNAVLGWSSVDKRFSFNQPLFIQNASNGTGVTLDIRGNSAQTGNLFQVSSSTGSMYLTVANNGNVGIGTSSPSQALSVQGNGLFSGNVSASNITATGTITANNLAVGGSVAYTGTGTTTFAGDILARGISAWKYLEAPFIQATSSTATSTFAGNMSLGGNLEMTGADKSISLRNGAINILDISGNTRYEANGYVGVKFDKDNSGAVSDGFYVQDGSGSTHFIVNNSGNVGIGTSSPVDKLNIKTADNSYGLGIVSTGVDGTYNGIRFGYDNASNGTFFLGNIQAIKEAGGGGDLVLNSASSFATYNTNQLVLSRAGNVGVGTSSPSQALSVQGNGLFSGNILAANVTATGTLNTNFISSTNAPLTIMRNNGTANAAISLSDTTGAAGGRITTAGSNSLVFASYNGGTEYARFTSSGSLGIGTTTPMSTLAVVGPTSGASTAMTLSRGANGNFWNFNLDNNNFGLSYNTSTAGQEKFVVTSGGNVGVGTTTPQYLLDVANTIRSTTNTSGSAANLRLENFQSGGAFEWRVGGTASSLGAGTLGLTNGGGSSTFLAVNSSGNVGIGTTSPSQKLSVQGSGLFLNDVTAANVVAIDPNATSTFAGGITGPGNFGVQSSSGRVGIGTAPAAGISLSVKQIGSDQPLYVYDSSNNVVARVTNNGHLVLRPNSSTDTVDINSNGASYFNGGNVGIGTNNPIAAKLSIDTNVAAKSASINITNSAGGAGNTTGLTFGSGNYGFIDFDP